MWSIGEIKSRGKEAFKSNYWRSVLCALLLSILTGGASSEARKQANTDELLAGLSSGEALILLISLFTAITVVLVIAILLHIFVENPLKVGCYRFFKKNNEGPDANMSAVAEGFSDYGHIFVTLLLTDVFLTLWTCLFVIPGLIKCYSYRMVPYIIKDNPELSATETITKSRQMMNGHKWKAFLLDLSFIGWILLGIITCGIVLIFWTAPYKENANAALYLELSKNQTVEDI